MAEVLPELEVQKIEGGVQLHLAQSRTVLRENPSRLSPSKSLKVDPYLIVETVKKPIIGRRVSITAGLALPGSIGTPVEIPDANVEYHSWDPHAHRGVAPAEWQVTEGKFDPIDWYKTLRGLAAPHRDSSNLWYFHPVNFIPRLDRAGFGYKTEVPSNIDEIVDTLNQQGIPMSFESLRYMIEEGYQPTPRVEEYMLAHKGKGRFKKWVGGTMVAAPLALAAEVLATNHEVLQRLMQLTPGDIIPLTVTAVGGFVWGKYAFRERQPIDKYFNWVEESSDIAFFKAFWPSGGALFSVFLPTGVNTIEDLFYRIGWGLTASYFTVAGHMFQKEKYIDHKPSEQIPAIEVAQTK